MDIISKAHNINNLNSKFLAISYLFLISNILRKMLPRISNNLGNHIITDINYIFIVHILQMCLTNTKKQTGE